MDTPFKKRDKQPMHPAETLLLQRGKVLSYNEVAFTEVDELYQGFDTHPSGLSSQEAKLRLQEIGPNVLPPGKKIRLIMKIASQFKNMFNILLLVAAFLSFLSGFLGNDPTSTQMGIGILAAVAVNTTFNLVQEHRAERATKVIKNLIPAKTKAVRDGQVKEIDVTNVVPGDVLTLEEGDRVPADLRLVDAFEVTVDNSTLTGESEPQRRFTLTTSLDTIGNIYDLQNILFAGTTLVSGIAKGIVIATARQTHFGKIVSMSREVKESQSPLEQDISYIGRVSLIASLIISTVFFIVSIILIRLSIFAGILFAIGVMICMVPEGFQLTVSLSLALTALIMANRSVVVKRLSSVETVGSMTVLCVDKTGTITCGEMMVKRLWCSGKIFEVTGEGYDPNGLITLNGKRIAESDRAQISKLLETAAFCNNCKLVPPSNRIGRWTVLGDPTDGAFQVFAGKGDIDNYSAESQRINLIPFNSQRRMMTSVHKSLDGKIEAYTKGAGAEVLERCTQILYNDIYIPLTDDLKKTVTRQMDVFASEGFRVLAMATRAMPSEAIDLSPEIENDMAFLGLAALFDPPRSKTESTVEEALSAGIRVFMLTGDHELTAHSIAKEVGIITSKENDQQVVTGSVLDRMSDMELTKILQRKGGVFARITPEQKLRITRTLKSMGDVVAVTGDGVNDSPALMEADVGIAMGAGGTDVARESADLVLLDNDFTSIIEAAKVGRSTFENLRKFAYYVWTHNWAEMTTFIACIMFNIPLPLLVIQVLCIDLAMDVIPSLSLIMEPPEPDIMAKPPRKKSEKLIGISTLLRSFYVGLFISIGAMLVAFKIWGSGGWAFGMSTVPDPAIYARGTTAVMVGIMFGQLGNLFSARSDLKSAFHLNPLRNKWILRGILAMFIIMTIEVYTPFLNPVLGTAPLLPSDYLLLLPLIPATFLIEELRKLLTRHNTHACALSPSASSSSLPTAD